jgi:hypothetical protein
MTGPQKSECPVGAGQVADGNMDNTAILTVACDDCKAVATLKASYAIAGHAVHELADGGFLVCRFNLAKHCPDLRALAAFAKLVGVRT